MPELPDLRQLTREVIAHALPPHPSLSPGLPRGEGHGVRNAVSGGGNGPLSCDEGQSGRADMLSEQEMETPQMKPNDTLQVSNGAGAQSAEVIREGQPGKEPTGEACPVSPNVCESGRVRECRGRGENGQRRGHFSMGAWGGRGTVAGTGGWQSVAG